MVSFLTKTVWTERKRKKGEKYGSISAVYEAAGKETDKNAIRRMVSVWHSIGF